MYLSFLPHPAVSLDLLEDLEDTVSHIAQGLHKDSIKVLLVLHMYSLHTNRHEVPVYVLSHVCPSRLTHMLHYHTLMYISVVGYHS